MFAEFGDGPGRCSCRRAAARCGSRRSPAPVSMPDAASRPLAVLMTPRWLREVQHHQAASLHVVDGGDLVIEVVRDIAAGVLFRRHLVGEAAEAVENADDFRGRAQGRLERDLADAAGGEGVVGDQRRLGGHHRRDPKSRIALRSSAPKLPPGLRRRQKVSSPPDVERDVLFQRSARASAESRPCRRNGRNGRDSTPSRRKWRD